jgi:hypothetical protein
MTLQEAIKLLTEYQKWRLGSDYIDMHEPSEITEALDIVLAQVNNLYTEEQVREAIEDARDCTSYVNTDEVIKSLKQPKQ